MSNYKIHYQRVVPMKKTLALAALLVFATGSSTSFAQQDAQEEETVTLYDLTKEFCGTAIDAALIYGYFAYLHNHIAPKDRKSPEGLTYDIASKGFCAAFFGDRAKNFFKAFRTYLAQTVKPVADAVVDAA